MQTRFSAAQLAAPAVAASEQILRKCVHCGFCTATCPTYLLLGDELDSPRGRIYLIKEMLENDQPATAEVARHVDRCLSCLACMTTCPSGVHYQHLIDHARVHVERTYRRPLRDRWLRALLAAVMPYPRRFRVALEAASLARPLAKLLPARLRAMVELAPRHVPRARPLPRDAAASGTARARVALLTSCVQTVLQPSINEATVRLLTRAGADVVIVEGCCGSVVHHLGRDGDAQRVAAPLIERLRVELDAGLDAIVVNASGCGTQLKDYGFLYRTDAKLAATAAHIAAKARDVTEVLKALGLPPPCDVGAKPSVAYHSACSMQHGQKIDAVPRELLAQAGFEVREIPEGHVCCGSAGTYNLLQPEIATRLRDRKVANLKRTGGEAVATGNIGCIAQLRGAAGVPVLHTVELLDWATGGPKPAALEAPRN
jgi:glycolate oxidase iron-sulfur subunit